MPALSEFFPGLSRVFLPVVHVTDRKQAARNVAIARAAGADGVFLIAHGAPYTTLLPIASTVASDLPGWFVGVNCLDLYPHEVVSRLAPEIRGIWSDNAGIASGAPREWPDLFERERAGCGWHGLHFGGVAFKYQTLTTSPAEAARLAVGRVDVICTSGPGTGHAADVRRIRDMREAVGDHPMALASGVTPDNVADYLPYVDAYLVATGISTSFDMLDAVKTRCLADRIREYAPREVAS